jgi:peptide/nickel transport system permease protein
VRREQEACGPVLAFVIKRLAWGAMLVWLITLICFAIFFLVPSKPPPTRPGFVAAPNLQAEYDLQHKSIPNQYVIFTSHLVHGDLGRSLQQPQPVWQILHDAIPITLSLVIGGAIFWLLIAFPIGIISAMHPRSLLDKGLMAFVLIGVSAHPVWLSLIFSYLLGYRAHVFPIAGYCDFLYDPNSPRLCGGPRVWAHHMVLPWFTFALLFAALYARMIRASLLEAMNEDYVRTARAKGASSLRVMRKHVLHNALIPVVAMLSMDLVTISFTGVVFIESIFQLPGLGQVLYRALRTNDQPVILGIVIIVSFAVVIANLIADLLYGLIDPRLGLRVRRRQSLWSRLRWRVRPRPVAATKRGL